MPKQNGNPKILAAGAAGMPVMAQYGFSRGQAMLAFAVLVAAYGVGCAVGGLLQDARGPRFAGVRRAVQHRAGVGGQRGGADAAACYQ